MRIRLKTRDIHNIMRYSFDTVTTPKITVGYFLYYALNNLNLNWTGSGSRPNLFSNKPHVPRFQYQVTLKYNNENLLLVKAV